MPTLTLNGVPIFYRAAGDGHPLLLVHGLGSSSADWELQMPIFAQRYRVLAPDLRGHGLSLRVPCASVPQYAADVAALLDALKVPQAHVCGLSLGGMVAQQLALAHPDRVASLMLVNTWARMRLIWPTALGPPLARLWALLRLDMAQASPHIARSLFPYPEQQLLYEEASRRFARNHGVCYRAGGLAAARFNVERQLSQLSVPTLVVAGDRDNIVRWPHAVRLARAIPGARLVVIHDSGHATPMDQPARFNRAVLTFLASVEEAHRVERSGQTG